MKKDILPGIIEKYLKGNCTPEEIADVHRWYNSFDQDEDPIDTFSYEEQQQLKQRLITRIRTNIASLDTEPKKLNSIKHITRTLIYALSGVAAIIVLSIALFNPYYFGQPVPKVSENMLVINKTKTIQRLVLADGSIVWLNPQSKLKYPRRFAAGQREVQMYGEVFFEVNPDPARPFIIHSDDVITRVLGTSFRIRAYKNIPVEVSVVTGKVSVRLQQRKGSEVMLLPNQKATYLRDISFLKKDIEKKASAMRMWQKTSMSFENESIEEVIKVLNKQFEVHISSGDEKLLKYTLKADFTDQSLPSILEMLKKSLDVEYQINNQEIILSTNNN